MRPDASTPSPTGRRFRGSARPETRELSATATMRPDTPVAAPWPRHRAAAYLCRPSASRREIVVLMVGPSEGTVSRPGFDGDLEARMMSWRKGILSHGSAEEVPRRGDAARGAD